MHNDPVIPAKYFTVIPAKAGIQILLLAIIVILAGCTSKNPPSVQTSLPSKNGPSIAAKERDRNCDHSIDSLLLDSLDHFFFPGSGGRPPTATQDHQWRWAVKTMTDEPENNWQSRYGMPYQRNFTIADLVKFRPEEELGDTGEHFIPIGKIDASTTRLWGNTYLHEYQIISVEAHIVYYKLEDDSDIHLILKNNEGDSLIAEVPHWNEVGDWARPWVAASWKWLRDYFGAPKRGGSTPPDVGTVFVVGMPFIDEKHNSKGAARNNIEIHPVLGISLQDDN